MIGLPQLKEIISSDPSLTQDQQDSCLSFLNTPGAIPKLLSGAAGSYLSVLLAKYYKLSPAARLALGVVGFGLGTQIYNKVQEWHDNSFSHYNPKTKGYEIDSNRY